MQHLQCPVGREVTKVRISTTSPTSGIVDLDAEVIEWKQRRRDKIGEILNRLKLRDGLQVAPPNIQYLLGRTSTGTDENGKVTDTLDIADKTQLILQSAHPVRYIVER